MIIVACLVVAFAFVGLGGGRLDRLAAVRFSHSWLIAAALLLQILVINVLPEALPQLMAEVVHAQTYVLAGAFVYVNRQIPWIWLVAIGGGMNGLAIITNGGVMPASPSALEMAGIPVVSDQFTNSGHVGERNLAWLGDVFAVPEGLPLANVFSAGDVVLVVGGALLLRALLRPGQRGRLWRGCEI